MHEHIKDSMLKISNRIDEIITEGLRRKGFEFEDKKELIKFVQRHCECVHGVLAKTKTYYANGEAFLIWEENYEITQSYQDGNIIFHADCGKYEYV